MLIDDLMDPLTTKVEFLRKTPDMTGKTGDPMTGRRPLFPPSPRHLLPKSPGLFQNTMNRPGFLITILISIFLPDSLAAQDDYWQQEVYYHIDVTLNDLNHTLEGEIEMTYINNSPDDLDTIYLHLWANAFRDRTTAFAEQQLQQGEREFYFADPKDLGYYSGLAFEVNDRPARWVLHPQHPDIAFLLLDEPLRSSDSLRIRTPFTLNIPASFSRLGHVGESYQMTQWYPKPAVYDHKGWHPMPYLDLGEFYSEFGRYDVTITLPENYVVGATGILQTESERKFLEQKVSETGDYLSRGVERSYWDDEPFPPSSDRLKTIRYTAEQVHDFAWFADKRFKVQRSMVVLPGGRRVDTWVMFTKYEEHLWQEAIHFVDRSLKFYSETVGPYPYPQVTAVQSALSAGSGMEYPMITVIGTAGTAKALDEVINHEVGHNWFYGVLAFNERRHPWMDEGLTTYYEQRYMQRYYEKDIYDDYLPGFLRGQSEMSLEELAYLYQARRHRDQAPDTPSGEFSELNYFLGAYQKPAKAFRYLEAYVGREAFDAAMQSFYRQWRFRHPYPADLRHYLKRHLDKNLNWLFEGLLFSNQKMDYAVKGLRQGEDGFQVTVKNEEAVDAPFALSGMRDGEIVRTRWYEGFAGKQTLSFPAGDYDLIVIDARRLAPELYRQNNRIRTGGLLPRVEKPLISVLPSLENDRRTQLYVLPVPAWNNYDKTMLGAVLYNTLVPAKRFEFSLAPLYSFGSGELTGLGNLSYHWFPDTEALQTITLGLDGRSFHFAQNENLNYRRRYTRLMPYLKLELGREAARPFTHRLQWRSLWIEEEQAQFTDGNFSGLKPVQQLIHELSYAGENRRAVNPYTFRAALEQQSYTDISGKQHYLKASLEWNQSLTYKEGKNIDIRLFAGGFPVNTKRRGGRLFPGAFNLISQGFNDYRYDDLYFGRTQNEGLWSQQISLRDGAFKTPLGSGFQLGRSNNFILALNFKADLPQNLPFPLPIKPYFDIGFFDNAQPTGREDSFQDQLLWSGGLAIDFLDGAFGIYFPFFNSRNLQNRLEERGNYWTRISFNIDFQRLNPFEVVREVTF